MFGHPGEEVHVTKFSLHNGSSVCAEFLNISECGSSSSGKFQPSWHFEPRNQIQLPPLQQMLPSNEQTQIRQPSVPRLLPQRKGDAAVSCSENPPS